VAICQCKFFLLIAYIGYMPPEYAIDGLFSLNSDVFSFDKHKIYVCHIIVCTYIEFSPESPEVQGCLYPYLTDYSYSFINKYLYLTNYSGLFPKVCLGDFIKLAKY
jgi:hypothetical protein